MNLVESLDLGMTSNLSSEGLGAVLGKVFWRDFCPYSVLTLRQIRGSMPNYRVKTAIWPYVVLTIKGAKSPIR